MMKNKLTNKIIISVVFLIILSLLNLNNIPGYLVNLVLLLIIFCMTKIKKVEVFIFLILVFSMNSLYLFINEKNILLLLVYYVWIIHVIYFCFKYVFGFNNKSNIVFKNISIPKLEEYLIVKYLSGPIKPFNLRAIIIKNKDSFIIKTEDDNNNVQELMFYYKDIINIEIKEKPYFKSVNGYDNYQVDFMKSYYTGRMTGEFDIYKKTKILKSYEIIIITNKYKIKLLSFDNPKIVKSV